MIVLSTRRGVGFFPNWFGARIWSKNRISCSNGFLSGLNEEP